jgi:putative two-component system response regulator
MSNEGAGKITLAVDDAPGNLHVIKSILVPEYTMMAAISGAMALKIAPARMPDPIFTDIMIRAMDGYDVCRRLESNIKTSAMPVVFVTGMDQATDEAKGLGPSAVASVMKPADPALLRKSIKKHLV